MDKTRFTTYWEKREKYIENRKGKYTLDELQLKIREADLKFQIDLAEEGFAPFGALGLTNTTKLKSFNQDEIFEVFHPLKDFWVKDLPRRFPSKVCFTGTLAVEFNVDSKGKKNDLFYLGTKQEAETKKIKECVENKNIKYVVFTLSIITKKNTTTGKQKVFAHANAVLLDTQTHEFYIFEPWGESCINVYQREKLISYLDRFLFLRFYEKDDYEIIDQPLLKCPVFDQGLQNKEHFKKRVKLDGERGFCQFWVYLVIEYMLKIESSLAEAQKILLLYDPDLLGRLIRRFSQRLYFDAFSWALGNSQEDDLWQKLTQTSFPKSVTCKVCGLLLEKKKKFV